MPPQYHRSIEDATLAAGRAVGAERQGPHESKTENEGSTGFFRGKGLSIRPRSGFPSLYRQWTTPVSFRKRRLTGLMPSAGLCRVPPVNGNLVATES